MYQEGLMIQVAQMYYYRKLSQKSIAAKLGLSVPTVSRILDQALNNGFIKVEVVSQKRRIKDLARKMCARFGLVQAIVIRSLPTANLDSLKKILGKTACETLFENVKPGNVVGIGPGGTMLELVESLNPERRLPGLTLIPLMGGWGYGGVAYEVNKLLSSAASALHCDFHLMPCPALVSSEDLRLSLLREPLIEEIVTLWENVDVAVFSIGGEVENGNYPQLRSNEALVSQSRQHGAVGDVLGRFIGAKGEVLDVDANKRIIAIPTDLFKKIPLRIGIGGGNAKIRAARAALQGGFINIFVSDESTCETILAMEED
jgi:deoxyribonucleoside regulator